MAVSYGSILNIPLTNYHLLATKQESYQRAYLLMKNNKEFSGKKVRRMGQQVEKKIRQREQWEQAEEQENR